MAYFTLDNLTAIIDETDLTDGLTDAETTAEAVFAKIQTAVENRVNGMLGARYSVPIAPGNVGADAFLADVCSLIAAAMIYTRRRIPVESWPFKGDHSAAMARLRAIAKGEELLIPKLETENTAAEIIGEDSKVAYSGGFAA